METSDDYCAAGYEGPCETIDLVLSVGRWALGVWRITEAPYGRMVESRGEHVVLWPSRPSLGWMR